MLYFYITLIVVFVLFVSYLNTPSGKGKLGEFVVSRQIGKDIPGKRRKINNVLFEGEKRSAQIDHILVNEKGIFVIETKNYGGMIFGSEKNNKWTQVLAYGKKKYQFYNPVKQNYTHVVQLANKLNPEYRSFPIYSIVVFTGRADIKNVESSRTIITTPGKLKREIKSIKTDVKLDGNQIEALAENIKYIKNNKDVTLRKHIKNIDKMEVDIKNNICPRCGGKLVVRHSSYGDFLGCENYPKCQFSKKI